MDSIDSQQWTDWIARLLTGENLEGELIEAGVLPGHNALPPKTNATIHVLSREEGYGTTERLFTALCGVSWFAVGSTGEHRYFHQSETHWYKHVNCEKCKRLLVFQKSNDD